MTIKEFVEEKTSEILTMLGAKAYFEVHQKDADTALIVDIKGDNLNYIIGFRGDSLNAFQHFLLLSIFNKYNVWADVVVDINSYKERKKERIIELAKNHIDKVRFFQKEVSLPPMDAYERKQIHEFVNDYTDIESYSVGNGIDRHIVLKLKG